MRDTELYRHLLGLEEPWTVGEVKLAIADPRVDVWVEHGAGAHWSCPECSQELPLYDHSEERSWRHLDSCQFTTYLHARPPRVMCTLHGVRQVNLPWAEPHARFTMMFERFAIDVLQETNVSGAMRILHISWDEAWRLMERAVARGQRAKKASVVTHIGVDEKAVAKGQTYMTLVCDIDRGIVEYIADDRKQESLDGYFTSLTEKQRHGIEAVAMDMWDPYVKSVRAHVPGADGKLVFDRFHIMQHMTDAVNTVRKREHRELLTMGDETLKGSRQLWLYGLENVPEKHHEHFETLRNSTLKTARAWALKEHLRLLWTYSSRGWGERCWEFWYSWATRSRLKPVLDTAAMIKRHLANVLTYFAHRITNAVAEGLNSKIQTIKQMACGFRNRNNFKTAIYFHCGGLQLYPVPSTHTHGKPG
jgi:transposase